MSAFEVLSILLLLALSWLWFDSLKVRELAVKAASRACTAEGYQFLDETVAITGFRLMRNDDGQLALRRAYAFEYSDTGSDRRPGSIVMLGQDVLIINVGLRLVN